MKDRIIQVRKWLNKTQREMAALLGISYKGWQGYEAGDNVPGGNVLQAIAKQGFNINWLLTGEGPMFLTKSSAQGTENVEVPAGVEPAVYEAFLEVMRSEHRGVKLALTQNTFMFQETVRSVKKVTQLENDIEEIKRVLNSRESDFKTSGAQGEDQHLVKHRGAGKHSE